VESLELTNLLQIAATWMTESRLFEMNENSQKSFGQTLNEDLRKSGFKNVSISHTAYLAMCVCVCVCV